jgi:ArsR family transcriptional regulator
MRQTANLPLPRTSNAHTRTTVGRKAKLPERAIKDWAKLFHLLADQNRLKILVALAQCGEMHVSALRELLGQSQPAVSHHLTLLRNASLIDCRREGKKSYYFLTLGNLRSLLEQVLQPRRNGDHELHVEDLVVTCKWE